MEPKKKLLATVLSCVGTGFVMAAIVAYLYEASAPVLETLIIVGLGGLTAAAVAFFLHFQFSARIAGMLGTLKRVSEGNYVVRCQAGDDEVGVLGRAINVLLHKLTALNVNVIDTDRELQWTQKELKFKAELAEKGKLLTAANSQLEGRLRELNVLFSSSRALSSTLELAPLFNSFFRTSAKSLALDRAAMLVFDERKDALQVVSTHGFGDVEDQIEGMVFQRGEGVSGTVFEKKTMLYIRDLEKDDRFMHFRGKLRLAGSALIMPLLTADRCVGVMLLNRVRKDGFTFDDIGLFHVIANQVAGAVANSLLYQKTQDLARHDELTGLYNRRVLETRLNDEWDRAGRFGITLACMMIDVDHFKQFNDDYGHLVGDDVLAHVGQLIQSHVRKVDTLARYGGEEFAVLLPRTSRKEAVAVAEKLRANVATMPIGAKEGFVGLSVTISLGVASTEDDPRSAKELLDMADHGLLMAKTAGRNRVIAYGEAPPLRSTSADTEKSPAPRRGAGLTTVITEKNRR